MRCSWCICVFLYQCICIFSFKNYDFNLCRCIESESEPATKSVEKFMQYSCYIGKALKSSLLHLIS